MGREARLRDLKLRERTVARWQAIADGRVDPTNREVWELSRASYSVLRRPLAGRLKWLIFGR